ncbi:hypothetical protein OIU78_027677 [Salix suchowensis]|nr:hypothetical protein OIU78_027677 [Salix suchowensis]
MGTIVYCTGLVPPRLRFCSKKIVGSSVGVERQQVLEQVDKELSKGDERAALSLVKDLQGKPGGLRCFGAARQIPQRLYTLDELKLNGIQTRSLLSPVDATLDPPFLPGVCCFCGHWTLCLLMEVLAAWFLIQLDTPSVRSTTIGLFNTKLAIS